MSGQVVPVGAPVRCPARGRGQVIEADAWCARVRWPSGAVDVLTPRQLARLGLEPAPAPERGPPRKEERPPEAGRLARRLAAIGALVDQLDFPRYERARARIAHLHLVLSVELERQQKGVA